MRHLFLSPHPDDAVLSCGGWIYQLARAGERVEVFTVMAGSMPPDMPLTSFIEEHVTRWGLGPDPVPGRQAEDRQAVAYLGGSVRFGPFPDLLYRTDGQGCVLYPDLGALFGAIHPADPVRSQEIAGWVGVPDVLYAPLGAGHHVDHQLVRDAALTWRRDHPEVAVFFYEEYPYSAKGVEVVQAALVALDKPAVPVLHSSDDVAIDARVRAIACYRSQISTFWDSPTTMGEAVRLYAAQVGAGQYAERMWT